MRVTNLVIVLFLITDIYCAPLMQLMPYQRILMQQQQSLQQQLLELQALQQINTLPIPPNNLVQPLLFFLPDDPTKMDIKEKKIIEKIDNELKLKSNIKSKIEEDTDSVVIDAEPLPILEEQKAFLVLPSGRISIGGIISTIPFLPIEINVPDTISWAYNGIANGIAGIISIIGQRLPFQRPTDAPTKGLKSVINDLRLRNSNGNSKPLIMLPLGGNNRPILPIQL